MRKKNKKPKKWLMKRKDERRLKTQKTCRAKRRSHQVCLAVNTKVVIKESLEKLP